MGFGGFVLTERENTPIMTLALCSFVPILPATSLAIILFASRFVLLDAHTFNDP